MNDFKNFRILIDLPAQSPALGFKETAEGLASIIRNSEPQFAIAIYGPWGSGKTTLMHRIKKALGPRAIAVDFSAWRYEREEHLIVPLLDTLRSALVDWSEQMHEHSERTDLKQETRDQRSEFGKTARKTAETVGRVIASVLAGLSFKIGIPGALDLSYDANKALAEGRRHNKEVKEGQAVTMPVNKDTKIDRFALRLADAQLPQSIYHACFTALAEAFSIFEAKTKGTRIVVFVDDLDRCLPGGTLEVLESMKLFFDMKGFVFVVGLDREVVEKSIDLRYEITHPQSGGDSDMQSPGVSRLIRGADYLKKIFQVPFSLAPVSVDLLDDLFASLQRDSRLPPSQMIDLRDRVRHHLDYLFSGTRLNPREVKRYINAYTIQMKVKQGLLPDVVLALNTLAFREDCQNLYEAIAIYRVEVILALRDFLTNDLTALDDLELTPADVPADIRAYLAMGGPAHSLLERENDLNIYLDAGESIRTSSGGYSLDMLLAYRQFRTSIHQAIESTEPLDFDGAWSSANSHFSTIESMRQREGSTESPLGPQWQLVGNWLQPGGVPSSWEKLLEGMNSASATPDFIVRARDAARLEAQKHLKMIRDELRQIRRRASLAS
ncbi:MAG: P-loop NTPase fold protein [Pseudomonadota bacterium]